MLCGVLAVSPARARDGWAVRLRDERLFLGGVLGSLEGWLGVRSVRTLELRVARQSANAGKLVAWLDGAVRAGAAGGPDGGGGVVARVVKTVLHASLQPEARDEGSWLRRQMPDGYGPVFAVLLRTEEQARRLPSKLALFHHATSLGGVESLIEWRAMTDKSVDRRLLRLSVGVEAWEDLRADLEMAFAALLDEGWGEGDGEEARLDDALGVGRGEDGENSIGERPERQTAPAQG